MSGKYRVKTRNKSSARVPKGMTCESNPSRNKYRAAALAARNAALIGNQMVAVDDRPPLDGPDSAVNELSLDAMSFGKNDSYSSAKSMISEGGMSRLSQFTSCTNPAFDAVHREWKSGSSMQTEVVSVLAAVAELIKERNGDETDNEYFAALITALEGAPLGDSSRTAATAYLLNLIAKKISKEVLQAQFSKLTEVMYMKLLENAENTDGSVLKNIISVLGVVLRAQPATVWQSGRTRNMLVSIAGLCTHEKPWVRTMSRRVVRAILTDPISAMDNGLHAASSVVGQFIHQEIEEALSSKNGGMTAVRYLCLLEGIMHKMPSNLFKNLAESILKSFAFADPMIKCSALQCLHRALQRQPCDAALSVETNSLLISALRQLAPPAGEVAVCAYWMQALAEAHVCLTAKDLTKNYELLDATLEMIVKVFDAANEQVAQVVYQVLSRLVERCIQDNEDYARRLLSLLDGALTLNSALVWKFVLRTQMRLYETAGEGIVGPEFTKALQSLAQLRQSDQCFCKQELDFTIGSAVRHVGAAPVLAVLPIGIDADAVVLSTEFPRSWLIPILRVNLSNAPLALFTSMFLPLAIKIYRRLPSLDALPQRLYNTVQNQLWELLPSFCESPCDLEKTFPELAPVLGAALNERKDLRSTVLSALRRCIKFALEPDAPTERIQVVAQYAKNFMPLMFNMYTNSVVDGEYDDKGVRIAVLETVRIYAEVTPEDLLARFVDSAIAKIADCGEGATAESKQARILDILCALVRHAGSDAVEKVLEGAQQWFNSDHVNLQKKAYRILEEVLARGAATGLEELYEARKEQFKEAVLRPYQFVAGPSRAAMINCMKFMQEDISNLKELTDFYARILDFVVLSLDKINSNHARTLASKMLQLMCTRLIEVGAETEQHPSVVLGPILNQIYALTASTAAEIQSVELGPARSTLVALNIIVQKQIKVLNASHTSRIVSHGCTWVADGRAPVRILAIRLIRVLVQKLPEFAVQQYRDLIVTSVFDGQLTCDLTHHVRKANRLLLEVLVEKFSVDVLLKYTTKPEWVKQMRNIDKLRRRKAVKAAGQETMEGDSDDEKMSGVSRASSKTAGADTILELLEDSDEEGDDSEAEVEKRSRVGSVWLKEDADGETTDLLDRSNMINKLTTTDPALLARRKAKALEKKKDSGFKFTKDGKIVIMDDDDEDTGRVSRKRKNGFDELDEDVPARAGKKVKEESDSDFEDSDDEVVSKAGARSAVSTASTWRPGGKGIHRDTSRFPVSSKSKKGAAASEKKSRTAQAGQKVQPYAYVPLRQKGGAKEDVRKILRAQRKSGKGRAK